jgi:hypothetical protein
MVASSGVSKEALIDYTTLASPALVLVTWMELLAMLYHKVALKW